ncbi:MAG: flagellar biosynthesis anti-sigma factor FlgM [Pirellulaceae bacterium]|jgi:negative regulator of flagellin synthesis FlgM|nr:flagellar biosynthesis anti-sigma factor FlgM [Pirellulaceae bacterium]
MQIHGPAHVHGPQPVNAPHRPVAAAASAPSSYAAGVDQLDISREADLASRIRDIPEMRSERVAAIRSAIEAGTYETPDKLEIAVGRLLDEMSI